MNVFISDSDYLQAERNGISRHALERRVRDLKWDKEVAISKPVKEVKKWIHIAKENGICKTTFLARVYRSKWSYEKAATQPVDMRFSRKKGEIV